MQWRVLIMVIVSLGLSMSAVAQKKSAGRKTQPSAEAASGKKTPAGGKAKAKPAPAVIKAGDPILIELLHPEFDAPQINSTYTVSVRGTLKMPRIDGEMEVEGLTCDELTGALENRYRDAG